VLRWSNTCNTRTRPPLYSRSCTVAPRAQLRPAALVSGLLWVDVGCGSRIGEVGRVGEVEPAIAAVGRIGIRRGANPGLLLVPVAFSPSGQWGWQKDGAARRRRMSSLTPVLLPRGLPASPRSPSVQRPCTHDVSDSAVVWGLIGLTNGGPLAIRSVRACASGTPLLCGIPSVPVR
jgi:hypothetical protein